MNSETDARLEYEFVSEHHWIHSGRQISRKFALRVMPVGNVRRHILTLAAADDWSHLMSFISNLDATEIYTGSPRYPHFSEKSGLFEGWRQVQIQQYFGSFVSWQKARISLVKLASSELEPGDGPLAKEILRKLSPEFIDGASTDHIQNEPSAKFAELRSGQQESGNFDNFEEWLAGPPNVAPKGSSPLSNKAVLVAGPGELDWGKLLVSGEGKDFVLVAPKMMIERREILERLPGTSARVGYYNRASCLRHKDEILEASNEGVVIRVKNRTSRKILTEGAPPVIKKRVGIAADPKPYIFGDHGPQLIAIVLLDLLRNGARQIRVSGIDFYVQGPLNSYAQSYQAPHLRGQDLTLSLRQHEIFSTRSFVQQLWRRGLVMGDEAFEQVMRSSPMDFALQLDEVFS